MSHFFTLVLVGDEIAREQAEEAVEPLLAPYDEKDECFREGSRWDWWVVGGRWTGTLSGYEPGEDPANIVPCEICFGSGVRPGGREQFGDDWFAWCNGCNGCKGTGKHVVWPSSWRPHEGDVAPVANLLKALPEHWPPLAVVTPDGQWHERSRMGWWGVTIPDEEGQEEKPEVLWAATVRALLEQNPEATAVVVDCHV